MMQVASPLQQYYKTALQTFLFFRMNLNWEVDRETRIVELVLT